MTFQRTMQDIPIGTPIYSRDGDELGTVKEVRSTAFKVAARAQPDYWLPTSCLSSGTAGQLMVDATKDRIGDLKVDEPAERNLINLSNQDLDRDFSLEGYEAYDATGEKLGKLAGVIVEDQTMAPRYVVVDAGGWFTTKEFVVPAGDIRAIDDRKRQVTFAALTKEQLQSDRYPRYDSSWWDRNDRAGFREYERGVAAAYRPARRGTATTAEVDYNDALYRRPVEGAQRLQLLEERLRVGTTSERAGEVRLGKRITERTETVNVPLREERVVIERHPVEGQRASGEIRETDEEIEIPLTRERARVAKDTVVTEEVGVRKEVTERNQPVQANLRTEELVVKGDEDLIEQPNPNAPPTSTYERERTRRG